MDVANASNVFLHDQPGENDALALSGFQAEPGRICDLAFKYQQGRGHKFIGNTLKPDKQVEGHKTLF